MALAIAATFLLIVVFCRIEKITLKTSGVVPGKASMSRLVAGYLIGLAMALVQACIVVGFGHVHLKLVPHLTTLQLPVFFVLYLLVALREELVFRSYALTRLNVSLGSVAGLFVITVIFWLRRSENQRPCIALRPSQCLELRAMDAGL